MFGTSGAVGANVPNIPIINHAGVVGHSVEDSGGFGAGVWGESIQGQGVVGRSQSSYGVFGASFGSPPAAKAPCPSYRTSETCSPCQPLDLYDPNKLTHLSVKGGAFHRTVR